MLATNMSCVDVMYQSYASYFPYQRPAASSPVDPFKRFAPVKQDPGSSSLEAASSYSSHSASSLSSLPGSSSTSSSTLHHSAHHPHSGHHLPGTHTPSSPPALSAPAVVTKIEDGGSASNTTHSHIPSPDLQQQQQQQQHPSQHHGDTTTHSHSKDTGGAGSAPPTPHNAQYLSTNCVLFTYYAGDVASHVDEHFTRALSQQGSSSSGSPSSSSSSYPADSSKSPSWKVGSSPMSQRNFPPSFWNSSYHQTASSSLSHPDPLGTLHSASGDAYMTSPLHSMSSLGSDPWRYSLTSQTHSAPYTGHAHHNVHDMAYAATISGTSRFQPHYGSLLGSSRLGAVGGQCDLGKHSMEGHWGSRYHTESLGAPNLTGHHDTAHHLHSAITAGKWY